MYGETGLLLPYFQSFSQEVQHLEEFYRVQKTNASCNIAQTTNFSEYDLGGEGDLFKAPEPIVEEPELQLDPVAAAMSMISNGEDVISAETIKVTDIESIQSGHLLSEVFYECKKDLLANSAIEEPYPPASDVEVPATQVEEALNEEKERLISLGPMHKSVSSESLISMEWMSGGCAMRPSFLDFQTMELEAAFCIRRTCSEGDIQTLGTGNPSLIPSPLKQMMTIGNYTTIEERRQKLSRYRNKKSKRNFGRKIKYACRKALADSQPRVRGRFAKTEEGEVSSLSK